jgi:hypothetical protein
VKKLLFILSILAVVNTQAQESYSQLNLKSDDFTELKKPFYHKTQDKEETDPLGI